MHFLLKLTLAFSELEVEKILLSKILLATSPRCLKITKKVSFNIASEASYVYILSGQKFIKMVKMPKIVHFGEFLKT